MESKANPVQSTNQAELALAALGSLAQAARLEIYRLLVRAGPEGMPAGEIGQALEIPASSLSFHLAHLARSEMVTQERRSRHVIYRADLGAMNRLVEYLLEDCCGGKACEADPKIVERKCG